MILPAFHDEMFSVVLHEVGEPERNSLLHRISIAATRAVNREHCLTVWGCGAGRTRDDGV